MKPGRIRYLLVFFAAMFVANNAVAAARACIVELAVQEHTAVQGFDAIAGDHACPVADDAASCLTHCTQSYKNDAQKFSTDVPGFVFAPPLSPHRVWLQAEPRSLVLASAPPVVGPPLTILFGNLRI